MISEIYILVIGFFIAISYFMLVGVNKSNKEVFLYSFTMVALNISYCIVTYMIYHTPPPSPILFQLGCLIGVTLSLNYIFLIEAFFQKKLRYMAVPKLIIFSFAAFLCFDIVQNFMTHSFINLIDGYANYSNLITKNSLGTMDISNIGKAFGFITALTTIFSLIYILRGYRNLLKDEKYLRYGIYVSFVIMINDLMIGGFDVKYAVPLFFVGYVFESLRFARYLYDQYKLERDKVISHAQENASMGLASDYTRAFAHDLRAIVRKNSDQFSNEMKTVFSKLINLYCPATNQSVSLKSSVQTALILFQTDIENKEIELNKDLSGLDSISNHLLVNSSIICSIIYGLLKNAVEALEDEDSNTIHFEISHDKYFITCAITNQASNVIFDSKSGLPKSSNKRDGRGAGLKLMQSLARSQFIDLDAKYESERLRMELTIPI
jgi:hypothetical protein